MHDPISFRALWRLPAVENEGLLHADCLGTVPRHDGLIGPGGLPIARRGGPVRPFSVGVLSLSTAEEIPLLLTKARLT